MVSRFNVSKTKILIFNKARKLTKDKLYFSNECLDCVQHYRYLEVYSSASGIFSCGQNDIFIKPERRHLKLQNL